MILIGEKLNSSIPKTLEAFQAKDESAVVAVSYTHLPVSEK